MADIIHPCSFYCPKYRSPVYHINVQRMPMHFCIGGNMSFFIKVLQRKITLYQITLQKPSCFTCISSRQLHQHHHSWAHVLNLLASFLLCFSFYVLTLLTCHLFQNRSSTVSDMATLVPFAYVTAHRKAMHQLARTFLMSRILICSAITQRSTGLKDNTGKQLD